MDDFAEHVNKNNLTHVVSARFDITDYEDEVSNLEQEKEYLEEDKVELERRLDEVRDLCVEASEIEEFETSAFTDLQKIITKISEV